MTAKINCEISEGLMPTERIVRIQTADGMSEEVSVAAQNVKGNQLMAYEVGRDQGNVLVELPSESASGRWRIWVKETTIGD